MANFCSSCGNPLSRMDSRCPGCGGTVTGQAPQVAVTGSAHSAKVTRTPAAETRVPGRITTGTVVRLGLVRQEPVMGYRNIVLARCGAALAAAGLVAVVLIGGLRRLGDAVLLLAVLVAVLAVLGVILWATLPPEARSGRDTARRRSPFDALWPLTLPMREVVRSRTIKVQSVTVKDISGTEFDCALTGRPVPATPIQGDIVEVYGRRTGSGTIAVRQLVTVSSRRTITARRDLAGTVARLVSVAIVVVWTVAASSMVWLVIS